VNPRAGQSPTLMYVPRHRIRRPRFAATAAETPLKAAQVYHTMPYQGVTAVATVKVGPKLVQVKVGGLESLSYFT